MKGNHAAAAAKMFLKLEDIGHRGAAEAVNALVIIAYNENISLPAAQNLYQPLLNIVGILIFIHQDIADFFQHSAAHIFFFRKDIIGLGLKLGKIKEILLPGQFFIPFHHPAQYPDFFIPASDHIVCLHQLF